MYVPLDVNFPDDDKIASVGLAGAGLYAQALCIAKRLGTNGTVPGRVLRRLIDFGDDNEERALIVDCEAGLLTPIDANGQVVAQICAAHAYRIESWANHNTEPTLTASKAQQMAHQRHHVNTGKPKPGCPLCFPPKPQVDADACADAMPAASGTQMRTHADPHMQEVEVEVEVEVENSNAHDSTESNIVPLPDASPSASPVRQADFDAFWERYPRKVGKPKAQAAYRQARKRATVDEILTGLDRHLPAWRRLDRMGNGDKIPHPTTWLNRDGWGDDPPPTPSAGRPNRPAENRAKIAASLARMGAS